MKKEKEDKKKNEEEYEQYNKVSFFQKIPYTVKALFIKYWFFGAIYFFIAFGLGSYISAVDNTGILLVLILALAIGIINDLMVYNILLALDTDKKESKYFSIYKSKKFYSFLINILYGIVLSFISANICSFFNSLFTGILTENWVCAEPFTYALVTLIVDEALIWIKILVIKLFKKILHKEI